MSQTLVLEWIDENRQRSYPLKPQNDFSISGSTTTLDKVLLDANFVYLSTKPTQIKLTDITRSGNSAVFSVTGLSSFTISNINTQVYPAYLRNSTGSLLVVDSTITQVPSTVSFSDVEFENSVAIQMDGLWSGVTSLFFNDNGDEPPKTGDLNWIEGYQFKIDINGQNIVLGTRRNYGNPISCQHFFDDITEDCDDIISYMNGVTTNTSPGVFEFLTGDNVVIYEDPENHRIYIGLTFGDNNVCSPPVPNPSPNVL